VCRCAVTARSAAAGKGHEAAETGCLDSAAPTGSRTLSVAPLTGLTGTSPVRLSTGTRAWTATASAPRTSPPAGPADVAPASTPASASAISLMNPSLPGPWIQPRAEDGIGDTAVRTMSPLARACASVRPTAPISGSVKVTRGSAR